MEPDLEQYVRLKCQGLSFLGTTSDGRAIVFGNIVPPTWTMGDTFQGNGQLHITVQPVHNYKLFMIDKPSVPRWLENMTPCSRGASMAARTRKKEPRQANSGSSSATVAIFDCPDT
ncbi:Os08g0115401 [Oryza sativa Japonica Group]|uniref:Os08g0115401 protein n=3 Tax=Oryza sativa TaxID=4530 RepID=Q6YXS8_ORYSJ|nr:hypothetical protein OsI_27596 [Oryza sativa Indica Group]BAD10564.1 hypothetical protein [Oryza sativa Japonica Group]BAT03547.1 Os08g0115401 [Oryza sativa Japonica Group]